ncbi:MAG: aerial mycelium formation protein [Acidimicrobiales bacterium]
MSEALDLDRLLADDYLAGLTELPMADLRARKAECGEAETALSYLRRLVQVRLDIVLAELQRRAQGGTGELSEIIDQLPEILAERGTRTTTGRFPSLDLPDVNHRLLTADLDRIFDVNKASTLAETSDDDVRALADAMVELERRVSSQRRGLHERLDALQAELVRRYKTGEASVDTLLG